MLTAKRILRGKDEIMGALLLCVGVAEAGGIGLGPSGYADQTCNVCVIGPPTGYTLLGQYACPRGYGRDQSSRLPVVADTSCEFRL